MAKSIQGLDGHLFLTDDTNNVHAQITGMFRPSSEERAAIRRTHAERARLWDYRHVICPAKEATLHDHLPEGFGFETHGETLARWLGEGFYDPQAIRHGFSRLDTHWTDVGARDYLAAAMEHFGDDRRLPPMVEGEALRMGDLGVKIGMEAEPVPTLCALSPTRQVVEESTIINEGYHRIQRSAAKGRALILHDSYTHNLFHVLGEMYGETIFVHCPDLDMAAAREIDPDVVWFFQAERFLPRVPHNEAVWGWRNTPTDRVRERA